MHHKQNFSYIYSLYNIIFNCSHNAFYVDNQRVKLKIVLPTTAMAKFAIDIAILESIFTLEINREINIPNWEVGRFSLLRKQIGRSLAKSGGLEALISAN